MEGDSSSRKLFWEEEKKVNAVLPCHSPRQQEEGSPDQAEGSFPGGWMDDTQHSDSLSMMREEFFPI